MHTKATSNLFLRGRMWHYSYITIHSFSSLGTVTTEMQPLLCVCILLLISRFECNYVFCRWGVNANMAHQLCAATWIGPLENLETNNTELGSQPWAAVLSTTGIASDVQFSVSLLLAAFKMCLWWSQKLSIIDSSWTSLPLSWKITAACEGRDAQSY